MKCTKCGKFIDVEKLPVDAFFCPKEPPLCIECKKAYPAKRCDCPFHVHYRTPQLAKNSEGLNRISFVQLRDLENISSGLKGSYSAVTNTANEHANSHAGAIAEARGSAVNSNRFPNLSRTTTNTIHHKLNHNVVECETIISISSSQELYDIDFLNTFDVTTNYDSHISRDPVICPLSYCQQPYFVYDFNNHYKQNHPDLHFECIKCEQLVTLTLNLNQISMDTRCLHGFRVFRATAKMSDDDDNSETECKINFPIFLLFSRFNLVPQNDSMSLELPAHSNNWKPTDFLVLWIAGLKSKHLQVNVSITAGSDVNPKTARFYSGTMRSLHDSQSAKDVFYSTNRLILSTAELKLLTNNERESLLVKISVLK